MTYSESVRYIESLSARGSMPGLERISALLSLLGDPHKKLRCVHVSGTNGKGSVCAMLGSILKCAGYRVGIYSSPFIENVNELFVIDQKAIGDKELAGLVTKARSACDAVGATQYEFLTALAFLYFENSAPDVVIIECCMGGLLDTTNVIEKPLLSVVTSVELEHTAFLGNTHESIACHKSGIIKHGCPCVAGYVNDDALKVIKGKAVSECAPFYQVTENPLDIRLTYEGTSFYHPKYGSMHTSLIGVHQAYNAMISLTCCDVLSSQGFDLPECVLRRGLENTTLKARFEIINREGPIIFDGAHNVHGAMALAKTLQMLLGSEKITMISAVMKDKDYKEMVSVLAPYAEYVYTFAPTSNTRALDPMIYCDEFVECGVDCVACVSLSEALTLALDRGQGKDVILVFGSLYSYKEFIEEMKNILNL